MVNAIGQPSSLRKDILRKAWKQNRDSYCLSRRTHNQELADLSMPMIAQLFNTRLNSDCNRFHSLQAVG
jgi:hypothetical protein